MHNIITEDFMLFGSIFYTQTMKYFWRVIFLFTSAKIKSHYEFKVKSYNRYFINNDGRLSSVIRPNKCT